MNTAPNLQLIPLDDLIPSPDNPRVIRVKDPALQELATSIKERGVLEPVLARPHPKKKGKYDLRAGARRHAAAKIAKVAEIPAIVRKMDDAEALEVTVTENLQREDLTPIEEARGVQALLDGGWETKAIAAHLGKSPTWVVRRAQITKLSKKWRKMVEDPKCGVSRWSAGHLELVACLDPEAQDAAIKQGFAWLIDDDELPSLNELERAVSRITREIRKAPWKPSDAALLPSAGACLECDKRSAARPGLFDDFEAPAEKIKRNDRCLDAKCWDQKLAAFVKAKQKELEKKHGKVNLIVSGGMPERAKWKKEKVLSYYEVTRCKKNDKGAAPCFHLNGESAGSWFWGRTTSQATKSKSSRRGESPSEPVDNPESRQEIAREFAFAWLARCYAELVFEVGDHSADRNWFLTVAFRALEGGRPWGRTPARDWLIEGFEEVEDLHEQLAQIGAVALHDMWMKSFGLQDEFDCEDELDDDEAFAVRILTKPVPDEVRRKARETFSIPKEFLEVHLRADVLRIAKDLGIDRVKNGAKKPDLVVAIMAAKLPAGTLTPELKKAFGVN